MVRARLAEMDQLSPGRGAVGGSYWNERGRARRFSAALDATAEKDPLYARLRRASDRRSTVVDVGAGTGRFSMALAPRVTDVVAVDPSTAMLGILRRSARRQGVGNVRTVESRWEDAPLAPDPDGVPTADVVFCSFVLPLIAEAEAFVAKMDATCRGRAFVYLNASSGDALTEHFWRHFHGRPRRPAPTYLDLQAILGDLGLRPEVEVVELPTRARFDTLAAAVKAYREVLVLPDTAEVRKEMRGLLSSWLVEDRGALRPPVRTMPAAIVSWPASRAR